MAQLVETIERLAEVHSGYRVVLRPAGHRIRAMFGGRAIADSSRVLVMQETRLPLVFYFPRADVDMQLSTKTARRTHCPFKGDAWI